jgi:uncharacterized protein (DUF433 family)
MLGQGVYEIAEIARYVGLSSSTVRSWFKWRSDRAGLGPLFKSDYESKDGDYAVSFLNLIEAYVGRFFRDHGVQPALIRRAHEILQGELNTKHPFAHANLCTDGNRIIVNNASKSDSHLVDVVSKQRWFSEIQGWLSHIVYGQETQLANQWRIAKGVVIDPEVSFGKPVVEGTGITTFVLSSQYFANRENATLVADLFDTTEEAVLEAVNFETGIRIGRRRAA